MSHKSCDILGAVAVGVVFGLLLTSSVDQNYVLYAGLAGLVAYAYVSIEVLPQRRSQQVPVIVVAREVPESHVPVESRNNGHTIPPERVRPPLLRIAV